MTKFNTKITIKIEGKALAMEAMPNSTFKMRHNKYEHKIFFPSTFGLSKGFELGNPREYFYNIGNIHVVLPSTPTLKVTLVLQLLQLRTSAAGWRTMSPP